MARPRKNAVKKQDALLDTQEVPEIPMEEQPYPLPRGWIWVELSETATIKRGASPRPIKSFVTTDVNGINWIKIGDTDSGKYITSTREKITKDGLKNSVFVQEGTLLLSNSMSFGRPYILKIAGCIHDGWLAITPKENINQDFLYYALMVSDWYFEKVAVGTAVRNLNSERVSHTPIPLPPLDEQQRIVDRIESLFAKLDEAKDQAEAALDGYETRKEAILHKAFSGELTERWRREKEREKTAWRTMKFNQIAEIKSNLVNPADFPNFPHIAPDNIEKKSGRLLEYRTISEDNVISGKHRFYPGYILYSKIRPYLSKVVIIDFEGLCSADMYPIKAKENTKFLWYYMLSGEFVEQASSAGSRSVLPKINQKELSRIIVHWPTPTEQQEIVRILDTLLAKEQQAKDAAEIVLEQIELMKKSILARAFRGELRGRH